MSATKYGNGYTWKLPDGSLCNYVEAQKDFLLKEHSPEPGSVRIRVQIVPYGTIGRLKIKEAGRTVRAKRPAQQLQAKIRALVNRLDTAIDQNNKAECFSINDELRVLSAMQ